MSTFTKEKLSLESEGKKRIEALLEAHGFRILDMSIPEDISLTEFKDLDFKGKLGLILATKFDFLVSRKERNEFYLVECKAKTLERFKGWCNVTDYNSYYMISSLPFPFIYLVWCKDIDKVYRHDVTDPSNFEVIVDRKEQQVYLIPENLFHEVAPDWLKTLDAWCRITSLTGILGEP